MTEETIFDAALAMQTPAERLAYLDEACADDVELRLRVEGLIKAHEAAGSFLDKPAMQQIAGDRVHHQQGRTEIELSCETDNPSLEGPACADPGETQGEGASDGSQSLDFLSPSEKPGSLGRLGHYEVLALVGQGGMGVVLKAFDEVLQRVVAIKVMAPQLATTASARKRFIREGQAAAAIRDERVIDIHAVEEANGLPYLVMEFVNGISLQERLDQNGPVELKEILRIGMQTAAGLAKAHAQGLIHRDIKPANILLENGVQRVKITDFGLARAVDDGSLSQSGVVAGTPQYMAPEQARGEVVDHRADLFSLGSVLYAMCTGRPPFRASTTMAILRRVAEDSPSPVREINPEVPDWLAQIIEKLHAKDPIDRFQSAAEVADLLGQHLAHLQQPDLAPLPAPIDKARPRASTRTFVRRWAAVAAALVCLIGGLGLTEATGVTRVGQYVATVLRIRTPEGTLVVEVNDADVKVTIDDERGEIAINGAGIHEIRLRPGTYKWRATRDGDLLKEDWVTVSRGDKPIVRVRPEAAAQKNPLVVEVPLPSRRFPTHGVNVSSVAFFADGRRFVSASTDHTLALWDVASGTELHRFKGHTGAVMGVAVSPCGDFLLSCSQDKTIRLWNVATGKEIRRLVGHGGWVYGVAFSPDGKLALSAGTSWGGTAGDDFPRLWDVATGQEIRRFHGHTDAVVGVAFSPDGGRALSASFDGSVRLWDVATGRELRSFRHSSRVYAVAFSPDGRQFISGCGGDSLKNGAVFDPVNCVVRLWDVDSGHEVRQFRGHTAGIRTVAWSPDGRYILSASGGEFFGISQWQPPSEVGIRLWEAATGRQLCRFNTPNSIWTLAFTPDGHSFVSGGGNGSLGLWELPQALVERHQEKGLAQPQPRVTLRGGGFSCAAFSRDGKFLAIASHNVIQVWDQAATTMLFILRGHERWVWTLAFSPDCLTLASASMDNTIKLWDLTTGKARATLEGHTDKVWCVAISPDGKTLASASDDTTVRLWNVTTGKPQKVLGHHAAHAYSVVFAPDGKTLVSGAFDGDVRLWDVASGEVLTHLDGHIATVRLALAADGNTLATASHDGTVKLWHLGKRKLVRTLEGHKLPLEGAAFSPDGKLLATVSGQFQAPTMPGEIKLWDVASGKELASWSGHQGPVHGVAFAPDGKTLATASADGTVKLWNVPRGEGAAQAVDQPPPFPAVPPFVILGHGKAHRAFVSLAEVVAAAGSGDTIEVRGNGPFVTPPISINTKPLTIRAASGFQPVIQLASEDADTNAPLLWTNAALVLEGLRLERISQKNVWKPGMEPYITVWSVGAPLHAVNCLFCQRGGTACVYGDKGSPVCDVRNCAFLTPDAAAWWWCGSGGRLTIANCLHNGFHSLVMTYRGPLRDVTIDLRRNTFAANEILLFSLVAPGIATDDDPNANAVSLHASENVFCSLGALLQFNQTAEFLANNKEKLRPNEAKDLLRRLVRWHDDRNVYAPRSHYGAFTKANHNESVGDFNTLADWLRFWGFVESRSLQTSARAKSEDFLARVRTFAAERVSPADFRLQSGSPGYRAGKDGRDLGADIELVGPGAAYERWKQTAEYHQWLKGAGETGQ
jgi:WD40 repeat protein